MGIKRVWSFISWFAFVLALGFAGRPAFSLPGAVETLAVLDDQIDQYKPILIEGEDVPVALGKPLSSLSLQAIVDGHSEPVPYQFDEYNTGGAVYFSEMDVPLDGKEGVLDAHDKLLFLYKDAGARRSVSQRFDGNVIAEIELAGTDSRKRYVYLVEGSRLHADEQYVRYSQDSGRVETDFYSLVYNKKNQLNWDDFAYSAFKGERPLDCMKLRLSAGLMTNSSKIFLNNDNFIATPKGERIGPIRTTSQMQITLWLLNLPIMDISYQVHHYPKSMLYDVRVVMPEVRRKLLSDPQLSISLDANQLMQSVLRTSLGLKQPVVVDNGLTQEEFDLRKHGVSPEENWIWLSTKRNFDVLAYFDYLGSVREPLSMVYNDSANLRDPPERFVGALPNVGYKIENFPEKGFFGFVVSLYLSEGFKGDPETFSSRLRTAPDIRVLAP